MGILKNTLAKSVKSSSGGASGSVRSGLGTLSIALAAGALIVTALWGFWFTVPEGHVGVVLRFSKATHQERPGLHTKVPWIDSVQLIEVRERKSVEKLAAATKNQLPATATVSINWTVKETAAMTLYQRYGSLEQFEERILDPKLRQASKAAISTFNADELIRNRNAAIGKIQENIVSLMEAYPVTVHSPQIENVDLPQQYMDAVLEKEKAREAAAREDYNLQRQKLEAQQKVQTAEAERDAVKATADGQAYKVTVEAEAEAKAIRIRGQAEASAVLAVQEAISQNPLLIEYERAKRWNGKMPSTMMGGGANVLWSVPTGQARN